MLHLMSGLADRWVPAAVVMQQGSGVEDQKGAFHLKMLRFRFFQCHPIPGDALSCTSGLSCRPC